MLGQAMHETTLESDRHSNLVKFDYAKTTPNKLRWDSRVEGITFSLYIPKWRVPRPMPVHIWGTVTPHFRSLSESLTPSQVTNDPEFRPNTPPIDVIVEKHQVHSMNKTVYRQLGEEEHWEVGTLYVPTPLTSNNSKMLRLVVYWS